MGYTTDFHGSFNLDKPLTAAQVAYLTAFSGTRRMKRNATAAGLLADPIRLAVGLLVGVEGGYYVGDTADYGQSRTPDILDYNSPPSGQPGLWCQWAVNDLGTVIEWNGAEKFYNYVEWLAYLIEHFLKPWGYKLNGEVSWIGEDPDDRGKIIVGDNVVSTKKARIVYED